MMINFLSIVPLIFLLCQSSLGIYYIYSEIDNELFINAQSLGERAKVAYIESIADVTDETQRKKLYLDYLEMCNNIDSEQTIRIRERANLESRPDDTKLLEQIGFKHFTAQFLTVPPNFMKEVVHMACSKHEQQLQCGSVFEGDAVTRRRIEDLKTIGNHKMMFDYECVNDTFAPSVYPCIGTNVAAWSAPCSQIMLQYWTFKTAVNTEIMSIYNTAVNAVKKLKPRAELQNVLQNFVFQDAMRKIAKIEGDKCELFKQMRQCVLPQIYQQCGLEAAMATNVSISLGYLRTERRERLHLDFRNFVYFLDPRCEEL